jgi:hypothetical protein
MTANRIWAIWLHPAWLKANFDHQKKSQTFGRRHPKISQAGGIDPGMLAERIDINPVYLGQIERA